MTLLEDISGNLEAVSAALTSGVVVGLMEVAVVVVVGSVEPSGVADTVGSFKVPSIASVEFPGVVAKMSLQVKSFRQNI